MSCINPGGDLCSVSDPADPDRLRAARPACAGFWSSERVIPELPRLIVAPTLDFARHDGTRTVAGRDRQDPRTTTSPSTTAATPTFSTTGAATT